MNHFPKTQSLKQQISFICLQFHNIYRAQLGELSFAPFRRLEYPKRLSHYVLQLSKNGWKSIGMAGLLCLSDIDIYVDIDRDINIDADIDIDMDFRHRCRQVQLRYTLAIYIFIYTYIYSPPITYYLANLAFFHIKHGHLRLLRIPCTVIGFSQSMKAEAARPS